MKNHYKKGITLLEVMLAIVILVILISIVIPQFNDIKKAQLLANATQDVTTALNKALSQTLASKNSLQYGVHFQSDKVIIFSGTTYSAVASDNEIIDIVSPDAITNISLTGGAVDVYFARLTGAPSKTGTITISVGSLTKTVTIGPTGIISSN